MAKRRSPGPASLGVRLLVALFPAALGVFVLATLAGEDDPGRQVAAWFLVVMCAGFVVLALGMNTDPTSSAGSLGDLLLYGPAAAFILYLVVGGFADPEFVSDPANFRGARNPAQALAFSIVGTVLVLAALVRLLAGPIARRLGIGRRRPKRPTEPPTESWIERNDLGGPTDPDWDALLDRVDGARSAAAQTSTATSAAERSADVATTLYRFDETAIVVLLRVERAAASGDTRASLTALIDEHAEDLAEARRRTHPGGASAGREGTWKAAGVVVMLAALAGAIATLPARRSDTYLLGLESAALTAGIVGLAAAAAFVALEWRRRSRDDEGVRLSTVAGVMTVVGLGSIVARSLAGSQFVSPGVVLGLVLQALAVAGFAAAWLIGRRFAPAVAAAIDAGRAEASARDAAFRQAGEGIDERVAERMRAVAETQAPRERAATRPPVLAALRTLYERGELLPDEVEWALRETVR